MQHHDPHFEISRLLAKLIEGTITSEEAARLEEWRHESAANSRLFDRVTDPDYIAAQLRDWENDDHGQARELLLEKVRASRRAVVRWRYAAVIAALLALAGGGAYLFQRSPQPAPAVQTAELRTDSSFRPRGNVAKLVMGNGNEVLLKGDARQEFEEQDGTRLRNGQSVLRYNAYAEANAAPVYHTLITPKGAEYTVVLADGTTAWLNAASSLHFPTRFEGKERVVELSGEAYFEVSGDAKLPFIVKTHRSRIQVLGTAFNVSAYPDMPEDKTTLASGTVRVSKGPRGRSVVLQPGFQAKVLPGETDVKVARADMEEAMAWKNGLFVFNGASLGDILRQIARWYDVDIKCDSGMEQKFHFTGRIHRYEDIAGVLELLEMTGKVKFALEGRTLVATPAIARKS